MTSENIGVTALDDDLAKKVCHKWPRRFLLSALFGSKSLLENKFGVSFGQFVMLNDEVLLKVYPMGQIKNEDQLYVHRDVLESFSDAISEVHCINTLTTNFMHCSRLWLDFVEKPLEITESFLEFVHHQLVDTPVKKNSVIIVNYYGKLLKLRTQFHEEELIEDLASLSIKTSTPQRSSTKYDIRMVTEATKVSFLQSKNTSMAKEVFIGGMDEEFNAIKQIVQNDKPYSGILIYGPSGSGKSLLAQAVISKCQDFEASRISGSDIFSRYAGETEDQLKNIFNKALKNRKSIVFIDEIDVLLSNTGQSDQERRVSACLKSILDDLSVSSNTKLVLITASSRPDSIDSSFRRPGRLETEIELGVPNAKQRIGILEAILSREQMNLAKEEVHLLSQNAHGYVGADLEAVIAQIINLRDRNSDSLLKALKTVKPSAMREVQVNVPNVTWEDIGGLDDLKLKLRQAVEWPIKRPDVFAKMGITAPKGVLMYGPPGCSKTMIAKALANESHLNFVAIKGPELFKKYVGESEQAVRQLFKRARRVAPCIVFFDEIDALGSERGSSGSSKVGDRVLAQMLTEMDGIEQLQDVVVVAATNRPDMIDKALMRPGRLDRVVYVPLPDEPTRLKIFQIHTRRKPLEENINLETFAKQTDHYSGAEIAAICNEAALASLEEALLEGQEGKILQRHFEEALKRVKPRLNPSLLSIYDKFRASRTS